MKTISNCLALLAASVAVSGTAQAQDNAGLFHQGVGADATTGITLELKTEPTLVLNSGAEVSGLFVDLIRPQQTWAMLNPSQPVRELAGPIPRHLLPVTEPLPLSGPASHKLDFAVLRFNF